ncbi:nucleotidyltransferase domain-containing protein [Flexivirga oryzae]|uniref:Amino acid transporter n=1 Tax=Flexivirga oryzae TaxID=1794944 RepID=A0A839N5Z1_9MICO|nr:hypothetical protein [Flexivirga oryzae]MBB2891464.1 hypothetical protein [Flexivirga oryzae]
MTEVWQPSEAEFSATYGPWRPRTPADVAEMLADYSGTWFIAGGWAIEAFTGVTRPHEDCDLSVLRTEVEEFRRFVRARYDVWAAGSGALKPVFADDPASFDEVAHAGSEQLWLRPGWNRPWEYDVLLAPGDAKTWVYKRDPEITMPMSEALWDKDGVRYLRPEIQLLYKARGLRAKDQQDFDVAWPLLDASQRRWLHQMLQRTLPGHPWLSAPQQD